ncbi:MAG: hypothetical protein ACRC2T_17370 [Thermoguttaceae bacterium]
MSENIEITALMPDTLAKLLSASFRRRITVEQIIKIAEDGNLFSARGAINLLQFTAFLANGTAQEDGD